MSTLVDAQPATVVIDQSTVLHGEDAAVVATLIDLFGRTPEGEAALAHARARAERAVHVRCAWGWCLVEVDPLDGTSESFFGPVDCPCEHLPGWRAARMEQRPKPQVPVKRRGRHGSRVQRSTHRHALPNYDIDDFAWLQPRPAPSERD